MKTFSILLIYFFTVVVSCYSRTNDIKQSVNAVLGDSSYVEKFGKHPSKNVPEKVRLQTHLQYVEQQLRNKDLSSLSNEQKKNRTKLLDILNEYWKAGIFPKNFDYVDQRIPCFIDKEGNICAVGYLIERTAGREVAENINNKFQYEYLLQIDDQTVDEWIESSGLTKEECAMIQPTYGPITYKVDNSIPKEYGVTSAIMSGANLSLMTLNSIQIAKGNNSHLLSVLGLLSGGLQVINGVNNYPSDYSGFNNVFIEYHAQRNLSLVNIGIGTSAVILSAWNFISNQKMEENQSTSWNLYSFPTKENTTGVGLSFSKRLE